MSDKIKEHQLERGAYEEKRARRQFDAVEPENRLVASELEARWNGALARVAEAEARLAHPAYSVDGNHHRQ